MDITVFGSGYVGLVTAVCLSQAGHQVMCVDIDEYRVKVLNQGKVPIYEPGLADLLKAALAANRLTFTSSAKEGVQHGVCQFIAVGTPSDNAGNANLSQVMAVAEAIGQYASKDVVVVDKSTVPIGTAAEVKAVIQQALKARQSNLSIEVVSNPEFLKEGEAVNDFQNPDRVVIGVASQQAEKVLREVYHFVADKIMVMDPISAEMTKYAANAMLATKISFMNEMALLADKVGADIEKVREGIGSDSRIGPHFLYAGCGFGGSCFGKDIKALIHTHKQHQTPATIIEAAYQMNQMQKMRLFHKMIHHYQGAIAGKTFAIWGLSFKPNTDDMRDAPSIMMVSALLAQGAKCQVYDPAAMANAKAIFGSVEDLHYCDSARAALQGADALVVLTQWQEFIEFPIEALGQQLRQPVIFDGRNMFDLAALAPYSFTYYGIGRGQTQNVYEKESSSQKPLPSPAVCLTE